MPILSMNPAARTLFGFTELDLIGTTKAPDLLGYDFRLDVDSSGHRQVALPPRGTFDVVVAGRPASEGDPPRSLVMLIPSIGGPMNRVLLGNALQLNAIAAAGVALVWMAWNGSQEPASNPSL